MKKVLKFILNLEPTPKSTTWRGTLVCLGIVFGSILTSPVYLPGFVKEHLHTVEEVKQVLAIVLVSLLLIPGALYGGLLLHSIRKTQQGSIFAMLGMTITGMSLAGVITNMSSMMADCSITPVVSIKSALEELIPLFGLTPWQVTIGTDIVLIGLMISLAKGLSALGKITGPTAIIYLILGMLGGGIAITYYPPILEVLLPWKMVSYAYTFIATHEWYVSALILVFTFLCVTGAEAMFADAAQAGVGNIRRSFFLIVLPFLIVTYTGQFAMIAYGIQTGTDIGSPWYATLALINPVAIGNVLITVLMVISASYTILTGGFGMGEVAYQRNLMPYLPALYPTKYGEQLFTPIAALVFGFWGVFLNHWYPTSAALADPYAGVITLAMISTFTVGASYLWTNLSTTIERILLVIGLILGGGLVLLYTVALIPLTIKHGSGLFIVIGFYVILMLIEGTINRVKERVKTYVPKENFLKQVNEKFINQDGRTIVIPVTTRKDNIEATYLKDPAFAGKIIFFTISKDLHNNNLGWQIEKTEEGNVTHYFLKIGAQMPENCEVYLSHLIPNVKYEKHIWKKRADSYGVAVTSLREQLVMNIIYPIHEKLLHGPEKRIFAKSSNYRVHYVRVIEQQQIEKPGNLRLE
jgi:K+ transporter